MVVEQLLVVDAERLDAKRLFVEASPAKSSVTDLAAAEGSVLLAVMDSPGWENCMLNDAAPFATERN